MPESNREGYRTLAWIINESEQGLFLVVADEETQKDIAGRYSQGAVGIYDYKRHPGAYSFQKLQEWVGGLQEARVCLVVNFHLAVQDGESLKRLNFSRDMLEGLGINFIFLVTPYGDDRLAVGAYDFYSFVKIRIIFHNYEVKCEREEELLFAADEPAEEGEWGQEELKRKLAEAYVLMGQAKDEEDRGYYRESEKLLLKARKIKEKLLGPEHLEVAEIDHRLAVVYGKQGKYKNAEYLCEKSLQVRERVLGEEHPDTAASYHNLAAVHEKQGKYKIAMAYYIKAYNIYLAGLGESHPHTQIVYKSMKDAYSAWNPEGEFEKSLCPSLCLYS